MILREIEQYLRRTGVKPTRFGREVVNDPRLVFDLRMGREPRAKTVEKVRSYIEARA